MNRLFSILQRSFAILLFYAILTHSAPADDADIMKLISILASEDSDQHEQAFLDLVKTGDARLEPFFETYRTGGIYHWNDQIVIGGESYMNDNYDEFMPLFGVLNLNPITKEDGTPLEVMVDDVEEIDVSRANRKMAQTAKFQLALSSPEWDRRLAAVKRLGDPPRKKESIPFLQQICEKETNKRVLYTAQESLNLIYLTDHNSDAADRLLAANALGRMKSARANAVIGARLDNGDIPDNHKLFYAQVQEIIQSYQDKVHFFDTFKNGLSTGSILILMALGLAITFGMMGVINMAHGEMMMIGAYTTFCMQSLFGHTSSEAHNIFFVFALPASFLVAALVGGLIEFSIVRHLYKNPLESLLATFGVSLVLIQVARLIFGDNQASNSPTYLVGSVELFRDMSVPYARLFILGLTIVCVLAIGALMKYTKLGLHMRATMQNRPMASAMGINTRAIDLFTFMLGSGIAGVAGCALTTIGGITPDMGQNYIIDSFLVVVAGGVGKLIGVICAGLGLGIGGQILEGNFLSPVWSKIVILIGLIAFIQYKPAGLFPPKGRLADD